MPRIPDRWLDYSFCGKQISGTPFVALKCPLQRSFLNSIPPEEQFGPADVKTYLPSVSMIIDLTNTSKFYHKKALEDVGIEYKKIQCKGHVIPEIDVIRRFFFIVDQFLQNEHIDNQEARLIGVHCTHGVNRTGFLICSYLICKMGYTFEKAVREFNFARGHNIERQNYLNQLEKYQENPLSFVYNQADDDLNKDPLLNSIKKREKYRHRNRHRHGSRDISYESKVKFKQDYSERDNRFFVNHRNNFYTDPPAANPPKFLMNNFQYNPHQFRHHYSNRNFHHQYNTVYPYPTTFPRPMFFNPIDRSKYSLRRQNNHPMK